MREGGNEQSLEGSTLSIAKRQKLHEKALSWKKINVRKNACTCVYTNTHLHTYKHKKLATEHRKKAFALVKHLETQLRSVMEFAFF